MKNQHIILKTLLLVCLSLTYLISTAKHVVVAAPRMEDDGVTPIGNGALITADIGVGNYTGDFIDFGVNHFVTFGFDHYDQKFDVYQSVKVVLDIYEYNQSGVLLAVVPKTMEVTFDTNGIPVNDRIVYKGNSSYKVEVKLIQIYVNNALSNQLPFQFYVDCHIDIERYYNFNLVPSTVLAIGPLAEVDLDCDGQNIPDELTISWPSTIWAEAYQLEWTFVNDYADPGIGGNVVYIDPGADSLPYDFRNNAVRVMIEESQYKISLVCEHGYLVFRVRAVGRDISDPTIPIYGEWSCPESASIDLAGNEYIYFNQHRHEGALNWQYQVTYAEEGKKKEVASYFDGVNKNRQTVTKINSDNRTIVGETIYDYNGRPAVNVLPTPATDANCTNGNTAIQYFPDYNRNPQGTDHYDKDDFDLDSGNNCESATGTMNANSGSSNYYSPLNPERTEQQAYVPDAFEYPFSQVEYTPDNTGRIRKQGGVGPDYKIGSNHETTYLYGQPYQIQLDRMFGSEAGDASHYKKNVVIDANGVSGTNGQAGQASVSYLDQSGRVVATALAGDAPVNLVALPTSTNANVTLTVDLLSENANGVSTSNTLSNDGMSKVFSTQLLVSYQSAYAFTYDVSVPPMPIPCTNICMTCVYDLEIQILNDCGDNLALRGGQPIDLIVGQFTYGQNNQLIFQTNCTPDPNGNLITFDQVTLMPGVYTVNKILTVNQDALDFYVNQITNPALNTCVETFEDYMYEAQLLIDAYDCDVTCEECELALGSRDDFVSTQTGTELEYDLMIEGCRAPCEPNTLCHSSFIVMLNDVKKGGQYGEFESDDVFGPQNFPLSVFNSSNVLPLCHGTPTWKNPHRIINGFDYFMYIDVNNVRNEIPLTEISANVYSPAIDLPSNAFLNAEGDWVTYPEHLSNVQDFLDNWQDGWEKSLVRYHPEYCYYEECRQYGEKQTAEDCYTSDEFDQMLRDINTMSQAESNNIVHIANYQNTPFDFYSFINDIFLTNTTLAAACNNDFQPYDPFVVNGDAPGEEFYPYGLQLKNKVLTYLDAPGTIDDQSLPEFASFAVRCQLVQVPECGMFGYSDGSPAMNEDRDEEWIMFKQLYIGLKQQLQFERATAYALNSSEFTPPSNCGCYNACIGNTTWNIFENDFFTSGNYTDTSFVCNSAEAMLYANMQPAFNFSTSQYEGGNIVANQENDQCDREILLEGLFNALADDDLLDDSNIPLNVYSVYNALLLEAYGTNPGDVPSGAELWEWKGGTNGNYLEIGWHDGSGQKVCDLRLDTTNATALFQWDNVESFYNLQWTGGLYNFSVGISYFDVNGGLQYDNIVGSISCIDIKCPSIVQDECAEHTTEFGVDLYNLINALAINGKLETDFNNNGNVESDEYVNLEVAPYVSLLTSTIRYYLGPDNDLIYKGFPGINTGGWLKIMHEDTGSFVFLVPPQNMSVPQNYCSYVTSIDFEGCTPNAPAIWGNTQPDVLNFHCNTSGPDITIPFAVVHDVDFIQGTQLVEQIRIPYDVCNCYDPSPCCQSESNILLQDMELFIESLSFQEITNGLNVVNNPYFTDLMQSHMPVSTSVVAQTSTVGNCGGPVPFSIPGPNNNPVPVSPCVQTITFPFTGCELQLQMTTSQNEPFIDIIGGPNSTPFVNADVQVTGTPDVDGNYYDFYFLVNGAPPAIDTVFGHWCLPLMPCEPCGDIIPIPYFPAPVTDPCMDYMSSAFTENAEDEYEEYLNGIIADAAEFYRSHCMSALNETFTTRYEDKEYNFTLYYYDQAGNLIRTVPPEGVQLLPVTSPTSPAEVRIIQDRTNGTQTIFTFHNLATTYEYNSLNQLTKQFIPDHDPKEIWETKVPNGMHPEFVMNAVQFVSPSTGFAAGYILMPASYDNIQRGVLYKTTDAGATWSQTEQLVTTNFTKVQMVSATIGYATSDAGIVMKTFDGGESWDMLNLYNMFRSGANYSGSYYVGKINDVLFTTENAGWLAGDNGVLIWTTDGGRTFNANSTLIGGSNMNLTSLTLWQTRLIISLISNNTGVEAPYSGIAYTNLGAVPGSLSAPYYDGMIPGKLNAIQPLDNNKVFIAGEDGDLFFNNTMSVMAGGSGTGTWQTFVDRTRQRETNIVGEFTSIYFKNNTEGVSLVKNGAGNALYKTFDRGATWEQMSSSSEIYNDQFTYLHDPGNYGSKTIAVGENGLVKRIIMTNGTPYGQINVGIPLSMQVLDFKQCWAYSFSNAPYRLLMAAAAGNSIYFASTDGIEAQVLDWTTLSYSVNSSGIKEMLFKPFQNGLDLNLSGVLLFNDGIMYTVFIDGLIVNGEFTMPTLPVFNPVYDTSVMNPVPIIFDDVCADLSNNRFWSAAHSGTSVKIAIVNVNSSTPSTWAADFKAETTPLVTGQHTYSALLKIRDIAVSGNTVYLVGDDGNYQLGTYTIPATQPTIAWKYRNTSFAFCQVNDIDFSGNVAVTCGEGGGYTQRTNISFNSGNANGWKLRPTGITTDLNAIDLKNGTDGITVGDGGKAYSVAVAGPAFLAPLNTNVTVDLFDAKVGTNGLTYICGDNGKVLYSPNYSLNNFTTLVTSTNSNLRSISFKLNSDNPIIVGHNSSIYQCYGTTTAKEKDLFTPGLSELAFESGIKGYVAGNGMPRATGTNPIVSKNNYYTTTKYTVRYTSDGGTTWGVNTYPAAFGNCVQPLGITALLTKGAGSYFAAFDRRTFSTSTGLFSSQTSIISKLDGANPPTQVLAEIFSIVNDIQFSSQSVAFAVGCTMTMGTGAAGEMNIATKKPKYWRTSNGGNNWTVLSTSTGSGELTAIHTFPRNNTAIAVGVDGARVAFWNGSTVLWNNNLFTAGLPATVMARDVFFYDDLSGYIVGDGGLFYRTGESTTLINNIETDYLDATDQITWSTIGSGFFPDQLNGQSSQTKIDLKTIYFTSRYDGVFGGAFNITDPNDPNNGYQRKVWTESGLFSVHYWYDRLGRLVLSQNTKQYNAGTPQAGRLFSYTLFDDLGRVVEVGQKKENTAVIRFNQIFGSLVNNTYQPNVIDDTNLALWIGANGTKTEVNRTYYDNPAFTVPLAQDNIEKRIASMAYYDVYTGNINAYAHATHYSYDIHGNVNTLMQDNAALPVAAISQRYKTMNYEYDLISGNVNSVSYQPGEVDQLHHRYEYDADNRIKTVETSIDGVIWDQDAKYLYYAHGPLARTEVGDSKVQGVDYAYTLQGWIKGMNSAALKDSSDIGHDGMDGGVNEHFAHDATGFTLGYYYGDYMPIEDDVWNQPYRFEADIDQSSVMANRNDLYNGNISHMTTTITKPEITNPDPDKLVQAGSYIYDQLNRLIAMRAHNNYDQGDNSFTAVNPTPLKYYNKFSYDRNGNISGQLQYNENQVVIDDLTYNYKNNTQGKRLQNRLYHVNDGQTNTTLFADDIDNQGAFSNSLPTMNTSNNYGYDEIGNLVRDKQEFIANITWTVTGKVKWIRRDASAPNTMKDLKFDYDAMGNRIAKHIHGKNNGPLESSTYYLRDAQGNVMGVYKSDASGYELNERHLYGSSRLGMCTETVQMINAPTLDPNDFDRKQGLKQYELSNHLGNVLTVVTDRKAAFDGGGQIDHYTAEIVSATDYYPFGATMKGRNFDNSNYRFGFNGVEKVEEVAGKGNHYEFKYREYDPRIGKFWSVDPLFKKYPWNSSYAFAENRVTDGIDLEGLEHYYSADGTLIGKHGTSTEIRIVKEAEISAATTAFADPSKAPTDYFSNTLPTSGSHEIFTTEVDAANGWGAAYNAMSIRDVKEYASTIYELEIDGTTYLNYTEPDMTGGNDSSTCTPEPEGKEAVADIHSHGAYEEGYDNNNFSPADKRDNERTGLTGYVTTPNGSLKKYDPTTRTVSVVNESQPSDKNDPDRKNEIE